MMESSATLVRPHVMSMTRPDQLCVFVKSLHLTVAAWVAAVVFLWFAVERGAPDNANLLIFGALPVLVTEALALGADHWIKTAGGSRHDHAHEWEWALSWAIVPMLFLFGTVVAMA